MGKAVFIGLPAHGHINPSLPVISELISRGEQIIYYSIEEFREKIEKTGAEYKDYGVTIDKKILARYVKNFFDFGSMFLEAAKDFLEKELKVVEKDAPDYIIHDSVCPWGKYTAMILKIKTLSVTPTFVFTPDIVFSYFRIVLGFPVMFLKSPKNAIKCRRILNYIKKKYDLDIKLLDLLSNVEDLNIVFTSRYFQPFSEKLDNRFKFCGPSIAKREKVVFPYEKIKDKKVILISLGTVCNEQVKFYRDCFTAFGKTDFMIVLSAGAGVKIEELGHIPENFIVKNHIPQVEVLKQTHIFVTHAGMNSVCEALYYGVPLVLIPQQTEQWMVARRVSELGAGISLNAGSISPKILYRTVMKIDSDISYFNNAKKLSDSLKNAGGYKKATDIILNYIYKGEKNE